MRKFILFIGLVYTLNIFAVEEYDPAKRKIYYNLYKAKILRVIDGDTVVADIYLPFNIIMHNIKLRLYGINTPELHSKDWKERKKALDARDFVASYIFNKIVLVRIYGQGKYGRWLAAIFLKDARCINIMLWEADLAKPYAKKDEKWLKDNKK